MSRTNARQKNDAPLSKQDALDVLASAINHCQHAGIRVSAVNPTQKRGLSREPGVSVLALLVYGVTLADNSTRFVLAAGSDENGDGRPSPEPAEP